MDTNGIPTIIGTPPTSGDFGTRSTQQELLQLSGPAQVSVSALVSSMLAIASGAQIIYIDTTARKVSSGNASAVRDDVVSDASTTANSQQMKLRPVPGQSGRSLEWEVTGTTSGSFHSATKAAIEALLSPVTPTYTVAQLVEKICKALPENCNCRIMIDQENGEVFVWQQPDGSSQANLVDQITFTDADGIGVELSEPTITEDTGPEPLKLEGGLIV